MAKHKRKRNQLLPPVGHRLTRGQKYLIVGGVGLAVLLIGGAIASAKRVKPGPPRFVNADASCSMPTITDQALWADQIRSAVRQAANRGALDPFSVTSSLIEGAAPSCTVYPKNTRNPGEAKFYAQTFMAVTNDARTQNLVSAEQATTWNNMMFTWAAAQGLDLSQL